MTAGRELQGDRKRVQQACTPTSGSLCGQQLEGCVELGGNEDQTCLGLDREQSTEKRG